MSVSFVSSSDAAALCHDLNFSRLSQLMLSLVLLRTTLQMAIASQPAAATAAEAAAAATRPEDNYDISSIRSGDSTDDEVSV